MPLSCLFPYHYYCRGGVSFSPSWTLGKERRYMYMDPSIIFGTSSAFGSRVFGSECAYITGVQDEERIALETVMATG